jgi:hypothetical protein
VTTRSRWLRWLPEVGVVALTPRTALVGVDGWGDGRAGNGWKTHVVLNDQTYVGDFHGLRTKEIFDRLAALGEESAAIVREVLPRALDAHERVVMLTHVPPFRESCWHAGRISDDNWLPHFTCVAVGEACREIMARRADRSLEILCGHTHGGGEAQLLPNLRVRTGAAEYGHPRVAAVIEVE